MADTGLPSLDLEEPPADTNVTTQLITVLIQNMTTEQPPVVNGNSHTCDIIHSNYDITTAVICSICFILGILYTFFGYRCFKLVMFLTGFLFGSVLVYMICLEEKTFTPLINGGIALGAGVLCGLLTMLVQYVGLFLMGFNLGLSMAVCVLIALEQFYHPHTLLIPIGVLVGLGIIFGFLTLKFQKSLTILGSSVFGGLLMISCLDFFIEQFMVMLYIRDRVKMEYSADLCWYSWIILGCWPFCCLVGTIAQAKITGHGFSHKQVSNNRRCKKFSLKRAPKPKEKPKENPHQSRYRHLYQVRRVNGDVISQNYIQTLQTKLSPSLRNMTPVPTEPQTEPESANTTLTQLPEV